MTTSVMREQLIAYLASADDKKIVGLYSLLEDNLRNTAIATLSAEQLNFLDEERKKYLSGEGKSYNWEEVKQMMRNKKAS